MRCVVCHTSRAPEAGPVCPQCGWDAATADPADTRAVQAARAAYRARTLAHDPDRQVELRAKLLPWGGLALGLVLLLVWLASCRAYF